MSGLSETVSPTQASNLTSILSCKDRHGYPEYALSNSNGRKKKCDGDVFHRHGIHPTIMFSGTGSQVQNNEKNSRPDSQYRLRCEGADDKHDERVKRGAVASVFMGM